MRLLRPLLVIYSVDARNEDLELNFRLEELNTEIVQVFKVCSLFNDLQSSADRDVSAYGRMVDHATEESDDLLTTRSVHRYI